MNNNQNDSKKPGDPFTNVSKRSIIGKKKTSVFKYIQLLSAKNFTVLCTLGCYLQHAFESREIILRSFSG